VKIGIAGLGLIGGSLAKAYKSNSANTVYGYDINKPVQDIALMSNAIDHVLDVSTIPLCDCIFIALYPAATIAYLEQNAQYISKSAIVMDTCGTKRKVCEAGFKIASEYGFIFAGGHPMAGKQNSGFKYSSATLFKDAYMIVVPDSTDNIRVLEKIKKILEPLLFKHITITTAKKHDKMIAFTSQMAHLVSNAYIKSPTAKAHKGFSAGSYKDLTRVAYLNEEMWTELFLENKDNLTNELDYLMNQLLEYKEALKNDDVYKLKTLLLEGKVCKEEVDGR
jgi:prephenate dehydrogenase